MTTKNQDQLEQITSAAPDFFKWGKNCSILEFSVAQTRRILSTFYGEDHTYTEEQLRVFWEGYHSRSNRAVTDDMRVAVFADMKERLELPASDEARIGAEETLHDLMVAAGMIPPPKTDAEKLAG